MTLLESLCIFDFLFTNILVTFFYLSLKSRTDELKYKISQLDISKSLEKEEFDYRQSLLTRLDEVQNARFSSLTRK